MRRRTALLALALCLCLTACGETELPVTPTQTPEPTPTPVQSRPFTLGYDPTASLHPITGDSQVNLDLTSLVYEGLYELNNRFEAEPVLAAGAETDESGLVWTIYIKEGVLFSDGTPLTAEHVASSLKKAWKSDLYGGRLSAVTAIKEAEGAVTVTLSEPNGALPALLDIPVVLEQSEGPPLGTGRYRYVQTEETLSLAVNGNRENWDELPYTTIQLVAVSTADRRIAAFDSGEVTAVTTDFSSAYALGYSGSYETCDYPTTNLIYVGFNTQSGACADAAVRKACSQAFDRVSVVRSLLAGHGDPACLPISPNHGDYDEDAASLLDYDIRSAEQLLEEAGYALSEEDGLRYKRKAALSLTIVVNSDSVVKQDIADYLAHSLKGMGVAVTVNKLGWENYVEALEKGQFDLYIGEVRLTGDFDSTGLLTGSLNYGGYTGERAVELLAAWRSASGEARTAAAGELWALLAEEVPIAPLCFKRNSLLVRWGMVTDLDPTRGDPFHGMDGWTPVT